jgi:hypothetical protein
MTPASNVIKKKKKNKMWSNVFGVKASTHFFPPLYQNEITTTTRDWRNQSIG